MNSGKYGVNQFRIEDRIETCLTIKKIFMISLLMFGGNYGG